MTQKRIYLGLLLMIFCGVMGWAQIEGIVTDEEGEVLPYTSVYIKSTTTGTTSNADGFYALAVPAGSYELVFQFVGYATLVKLVDYQGGRMKMDIIMAREALQLSEVVISANAEDPAYAIIRKAIERRTYYKDLIASYVCKVYVKGNTQVLDAPEKILGFEVGDMEGALDSNRQGIVYLSESVSDLYFQAPDKFKEVVTSSKISGDDQGYSFNSAREMQYNFYENTMDLNRQLISPIASRALNYYDYKLLSTFQDEYSNLVHKIQVIPKRSADPVFYGTIYIVDDLWNIHSLQLGATAKSTQLYFVDSLTFRQVYIPVNLPDKWLLFNNSISFKLSGFGFVFAGAFTAVYSEYDLNPAFADQFFNREVHLVEDASNERDSAFWAVIRPVPLTRAEAKDYIRKDSIQAVRNDPIYQDSVDRVNNRFNPGNLLGGYNYTRTKRHFYWSLSSPLVGIGYNTVQGFNPVMRFNLRKYFDKKETERLLLFSEVNYGFSDNQWRANGSLVYRPSRKNRNEYLLTGGTDVSQFNRGNPISRTTNTWYSLLAKRNYAKYFGLSYIAGRARHEMASGLLLSADLRWERRTPLVNATDYSFFGPDNRMFTPNLPIHPDLSDGGWDRHSALLLQLDASFRLNQEFVVYPDQRFSTGSSGPLLRLRYRQGLGILEDDVSFQFVSATIEDNVEGGVAGHFSYFFNAGIFFNVDRLEFVDYQHFMGTQTFFTPEDRYNRRFLLLPYYALSTKSRFIQLHFQHHFDGFIMDKLPGLNALGFGVVGGIKYLYSHPYGSYGEIHVGLDKLGIKLFRLLRFDAVLSVQEGRSDWGFRLGVKIN